MSPITICPWGRGKQYFDNIVIIERCTVFTSSCKVFKRLKNSLTIVTSKYIQIFDIYAKSVKYMFFDSTNIKYYCYQAQSAIKII